MISGMKSTDSWSLSIRTSLFTFVDRRREKLHCILYGPLSLSNSDPNWEVGFTWLNRDGLGLIAPALDPVDYRLKASPPLLPAHRLIHVPCLHRPAPNSRRRTWRPTCGCWIPPKSSPTAEASPSDSSPSVRRAARSFSRPSLLDNSTQYLL